MYNIIYIYCSEIFLFLSRIRVRSPVPVLDWWGCVEIPQAINFWLPVFLFAWVRVGQFLQNGESQLRFLLFLLWISSLWALGIRDGCVTAWVMRKYLKCDNVAQWKQVPVDKSCVFSSFIAREWALLHSFPFSPLFALKLIYASVVGRIMIILHNVLIFVLNLLRLIDANSSKLPRSCSPKHRRIVIRM